MSKQADPAFPCGDFRGSMPMPGMSLRDYFAGQALVGIASSISEYGPPTQWGRVSEDAYRAADAMLSARKGASDE